jgi:hypothetical protein
LLRQWIENPATTFSSRAGEKAGGSQKGNSFYQIEMKLAEKKISLVGWGEKQVMFHTVNGHPGVSVVDNNRITLFGLTPWLRGLVAAVPAEARYCHGTLPDPENAELVSNMRDSAFIDAITALETQDICLLAEAITTTYMAQQYMGAELLPNRGEIAKRFSGRFGLYLFQQPHAVTAELKSNAVMAS